jgi:multimeric flavodoxin WrbA
MKVIAFNGSPKADGNTFFALKTVAERLEQAGVEEEIVHVGNKAIRGCIACYKCVENQNRRCSIDKDLVNEVIDRAIAADGLLLGSPVYYSGVNGTLKSFLDRLFFVAGASGGLFRHKVGATVAAVRRSGGIPTLNTLNQYLLIAEMIMPGSNYWNAIHGRTPGEAAQDEEGVQTMQVLGDNVAWLLKLIEAGKGKVEAPKRADKVYTSFIR